MSISFWTEGKRGQRAEVWMLAFFFFQVNEWLWKSHFLSSAMLINCPFVLSPLHFHSTCRQTSPWAGGKNKLPAVHIVRVPFRSGAVQIKALSFRWLHGNIKDAFCFGSPPCRRMFLFSLFFWISFQKHGRRHSGVRWFSAFQNWKRKRQKVKTKGKANWVTVKLKT